MATSAGSQYLQTYADVNGAYKDYLKNGSNSPDAATLAQYGSGAKTLNADQYALMHYDKYGKGEKRLWGVSTAGTGTGTGTGSTMSGTNAYLANNPSPDNSGGSTSPNAGTANVAQAATTNWNVNGNQLVQNQMQGLLAQNNPLVQMAQTQGLEAAQQRGLLNSSLGAEAGALAHYQYAMPIATADANTYASAARQNASEANQVGMFNAGSLNTKSNLDTTLQNSNYQLAQNLSNDQWKTKGGWANSENLANLNNTAAMERATVGYANDQTMAGINNTAAMERQIASINATAAQNLQNIDANYQQQYRSAMTGLQSTYSQVYQNIQTSNIPQEAKVSQYENATIELNNWVDYYSALYKSSSAMTGAFAALKPV